MKIIIGKYEGTIYPEDNGYTGAIELGTNGKGDRNCLKRKGRTKEIVKDKLKKAVSELEAGIETSDDYTVENAVRDWPARGTKGLPAKTINDYKSLADSNLLRAGKAWQDNDLVFATSVGTGLDVANVRRITKTAGLGDNWTPRELRHSFVSIMSDSGVTIEQIADLVGHRTTIVIQKVYRHQLKPAISTGATAMNTVFGNKKSA
jgi:integrase